MSTYKNEERYFKTHNKYIYVPWYNSVSKLNNYDVTSMGQDEIWFRLAAVVIPMQNSLS